MEKFYYSPLKKSFFSSEIHGSNIPEDSIEIGSVIYNSLIEGLNNGYSVELDGEFPILVKNELGVEEKLKTYESRLQLHLDSVAKQYGYDSIMTAVSYADEPSIVKFQKEGMAFRKWRSLFWSDANKIKDEVLSGNRPVPKPEDLIAELPKLVIE